MLFLELLLFSSCSSSSPLQYKFIILETLILGNFGFFHLKCGSDKKPWLNRLNHKPKKPKKLGFATPGIALILKFNLKRQKTPKTATPRLDVKTALKRLWLNVNLILGCDECVHKDFSTEDKFQVPAKYAKVLHALFYSCWLLIWLYCEVLLQLICTSSPAYGQKCWRRSRLSLFSLRVVWNNCSASVCVRCGSVWRKCLPPISLWQSPP